MSSGKVAGRQSLWSDVSFADLWRAVRYRRWGGLEGLPAPLDVAHASRFSAPSQPWAPEAGASALQRAFDLQRTRQAA